VTKGASRAHPAGVYVGRYPHELSGGQRQRVAIADSLVLDPEFLVADEPGSMLDVSVRAGALTLLDGLRRAGNMGVIMITHDLSTAAHFADRIASCTWAGSSREVRRVTSCGTLSIPTRRVSLRGSQARSPRSLDLPDPEGRPEPGGCPDRLPVPPTVAEEWCSTVDRSCGRSLDPPRTMPRACWCLGMTSELGSVRRGEGRIRTSMCCPRCSFHWLRRSTERRNGSQRLMATAHDWACS
jgi:hypothetical protein